MDSLGKTNLCLIGANVLAGTAHAIFLAKNPSYASLLGVIFSLIVILYIIAHAYRR